MASHDDIALEIRSFQLGETLRPYFTALYVFAIRCPPGHRIEDQLHPNGPR